MSYIKEFDSTPGVGLLTREDIDKSVVEYTSWSARSSFVERSYWIPSVNRGVKNFYLICCLSLWSFRDTSTNSKNKLIKHQSYSNTKSCHFHGSFLNHLHIRIYFPTTLWYLPILGLSTQQINKSTLCLNRTKPCWYQSQTIYRFLYKPLHFEIQYINLIWSRFQKVYTILVLMSVPKRYTRLIYNSSLWLILLTGNSVSEFGLFIIAFLLFFISANSLLSMFRGWILHHFWN